MSEDLLVKAANSLVEENKIVRFMEYGVHEDERTIFLTGEIDMDIGDQIGQGLFHLQRISLEPIKIIINSVGGGDEVTFYLYDAIVNSRAPITTIGSGMVCSAAALLLVCGDVRMATENCWYMTHKGSTTLEGDDDVIEAGAELNRKTSDRYWKLVARHTKKSASWWYKSSRDRGELWLDPKQMLEYGVIDSIYTSPRRHLEPLSNRSLKQAPPEESDD